jgi:hypothetical protein
LDFKEEDGQTCERPEAQSGELSSAIGATGRVIHKRLNFGKDATTMTEKAKMPVPEERTDRPDCTEWIKSHTQDPANRQSGLFSAIKEAMAQRPGHSDSDRDSVSDRDGEAMLLKFHDFRYLASHPAEQIDFALGSKIHARRSRGEITMRRFLFFIFLFFGGALSFAQTPTLVQHVSCPNSGAIGSGVGGEMSSVPVYLCPLPEPSQSGNALVLGMFSDNAGNPTWTVTDDKSNTWTLATSATDSEGNIFAIYYALNVAAGTRFISVKSSAATNGFLAVSASEYYNVSTASALDAKSCAAGSNSTSISAGSLTPSVSGDLLWQWGANANAAEIASISAGSQSNVTWQLNGTDIHDGDGTQAGVYSSTAAINPTFTSGTSEPWDSCAIALKAATAGTAPTQPFRIVHMLHEQMLASDSSPFHAEMPTSGNLLLISFISGGNSITSITSNPSNTWSSTGALVTYGSQATSQIYYAANASTANAMTFSIGQTGTMTGTTFMMYDVVGAAASPFDVDSGGQSGDQKSTVSSLTSCSGCITPSAANELIIGNIGNAWCTNIGITSPSSALFDVATYTGNSVNGPEPVDQNNGWFHYYDPGTSAITATWSYTCGSEAEGSWVGRLAAFKSAPQTQPLPPTSVRGSAQPQPQ